MPPSPPDNQETNYQGKSGRQFKNALYADVGATPYYWEFGSSWDEKSSESGWQFKRKGDVYVAVGLGSKNASAEVAERGVDYLSYSAFKSAVKSNASLGTSSYTTSKGVTIGKNDYCGLNSPGDCQFPFDPMETESSNGKLINWSGGVMTVTKGGKSCRYDFNNWTFSGACGSSGGPPGPTFPPEPTDPPSVPTNTPIPTGAPIPGDADGDGDVDIFDYNILIGEFGQTGSLSSDFDRDGDVDIFDYNILIGNFGTTVSPTQTPIVTPTPTSSGNKFEVGDRVETTETANVKVSPGEGLIDTHPAGVKGTVLQGPELGVGGVNWWWDIDFDIPPDGWTREDLLVKL